MSDDDGAMMYLVVVDDEPLVMTNSRDFAETIAMVTGGYVVIAIEVAVIDEPEDDPATAWVRRYAQEHRN